MLTRHLPVAPEPDSGAADVSAFIAGFVVFGMKYSFGVFFTPVEAEFQASRNETSVVFAITGLHGGRRPYGSRAEPYGSAPRMWIGYVESNLSNLAIKTIEQRS